MFAPWIGLLPFPAENRLEMGYRLGMPELPPLFADLQKKLSDAMASGPAAQVQAQLRQTLDATLQKMDLVTREEFDQQGLLLEQALMKLAELEAQLKALTSGTSGSTESSGVGKTSSGSSDPTVTSTSPSND
ncbi:MAG: accessory factor UbiK family protein [Burkholderiaceae bacterium]